MVVACALDERDGSSFEASLRLKIQIYYKIKSGGVKTSKLIEKCQQIRKRAAKLEKELEGLPELISDHYQDYVRIDHMPENKKAHPQLVSDVLSKVIDALIFTENGLKSHSGKKGSLQTETAARHFLTDSAGKLFARFVRSHPAESDEVYFLQQKQFVIDLFKGLKICVPKRFSFSKRLNKLRK